MARYLLVPCETGSIPAMVARARDLAAQERDASFVLLTPLPRGVYDRVVADHLAAAAELVAIAQLRAARLDVERTEIGDHVPILAIEDELRARPRACDAVVLAARPRGLARILGLDVHSQAGHLPIPVVHVYEGCSAHVPDPLIWRMRHRIARAAAPFGFLARMVEHRRLGLLVLCLPMLIYLTIGIALAVFINRRFYFNDAVALVLYIAMFTALLISERSERRARQGGARSADATGTPRRRNAPTR